jgi:hypothetical protein
VNPSILGGFLSALLPFITKIAAKKKKTVLNGPFVAGCRAVLFSTRTDFASLSE